ncbi:MAG: hypothetical protein ACK528_03480 [Alphaproteobacteria bacterium]|jgi:hypothetical protein
MIDFVKRLGQWHKYISGQGIACGMPALGNNYAKEIPEEKRIPCPNCMDSLGFTYSVDEVNEMFGLN